jgi:hypothetical protein
MNVSKSSKRRPSSRFYGRFRKLLIGACHILSQLSFLLPEINMLFVHSGMKEMLQICKGVCFSIRRNIYTPDPRSKNIRQPVKNCRMV